MKMRISEKSMYGDAHYCCCYCFFHCVFSTYNIIDAEQMVTLYFCWFRCDPYEILIMLLIKRSYNCMLRQLLAQQKAKLKRFLLFDSFCFKYKLLLFMPTNREQFYRFFFLSQTLNESEMDSLRDKKRACRENCKSDANKDYFFDISPFFSQLLGPQRFFFLPLMIVIINT